MTAVLLTGTTGEAWSFRAAVHASERDSSELLLLRTERGVRGAVRRPWSLNALTVAKEKECNLLLLPSAMIPFHDSFLRRLGAKRGVEVRCLSGRRVDRREAKEVWDAGVPWWF